MKQVKGPLYQELKEATKYPLLMRIAARFHLDGMTMVSVMDASNRGEYYLIGEPSLNAVYNYLRDFDLTPPDKRLTQLAKKL
jgi:hypothetical protein